MRAIAVLAVIAFPAFTAAQQPKPEPKYEGKPLEYWVERLQKAEKEEDRNKAATAIGDFGVDGAPAVPALMEMLHDRSRNYRNQVAGILCEIGPGAKAAVPELVKRLKEKHALKPRKGKELDTFLDIRNLLEILGAIGADAKEAVPTIAVLLENPDYCNEAIRALCRIGPDAKKTIPAIRHAIMDFLNPESNSTAKRATDWLHLLGPEAAPLLLDLLVAPDRTVQKDAFAGLNQLDPAAIQSSPQLMKWLAHNDPITRYYAAVLLWKIDKNNAAIPAFVGLLKEQARLTDNEPTYGEDKDFVALRAVEMLGEIGPDAKEALPTLHQANSMGFLMWYFIASRFERHGDFLFIPSSFKNYDRVEHLIAVGHAAQKAIKKIESPQTPKEVK